MSIEALTSAECGYIAGLLDGEGTLTALPSRKSPSKVAVDVAIRISSTHLGVIEWVQERCGGNYSTKPINGVRTKPIHEWKVGCRDGELLLRRLLPYLTAKRTQAELWLEIAELVGHRGKRISSTDHERRLALINDLQESRRAS